MLFGLVIFPVTRLLYKRFFTRFSHWVLDTRPSPAVPIRRFVWALNDGGPFGIRIGANIHPAQPPGQAPDVEPVPDLNAPPGGDAGAAAEHTIRVSGASLGRLLGGALILPAISNAMGNLLWRLSKRYSLLRHILAVRPPLNGRIPPPPIGPYLLNKNWDNMSYLKRIGVTFRVVFGAFWGGTPTWVQCDPVW